MDPDREKRMKEKHKALAFIQSSLAYPDPAGFKDFLSQLVYNLLVEGEALSRERNWEEAVRELTEGLNIVQYAAAEECEIPEALVESLYVNRAAAYHSMGEYELGLQDCIRALEVCKESYPALYRKALCLKELGLYKEAYKCTTECLLLPQQDTQLNELAQELATHLGLKNRKPYISVKDETVTARGVINGNTTAEAVKVPSTYLGKVSFASMPQSTVPSTFPSRCQLATTLGSEDLDTLEDTELMGDDLDSLLDCFPNKQESDKALFPEPRVKFTSSSTFSSPLPAPTPQLPPAFFSSAVCQLNSLDFLSLPGGEASARPSTLDSLDDLSLFDLRGDAGAAKLGVNTAVFDGLDSLDELLDLSLTADGAEDVHRPGSKADDKTASGLLDELDTWESVSDLSGRLSKSGADALDHLDSLDASFSSADGIREAFPAAAFGERGITPSYSAEATFARSSGNNYMERNNHLTSAGNNALSSTHKFMQACSACFPREGQGIYTFVHKPDLIHKCKRDLLLCRTKSDFNTEWTRVRPSTWTSFTGPFVLCRELLKSGDIGLCKYGEKCTFAFNQIEIDVWTEERKGTLDRSALFDTTPVKLDPVNSIIRLLQENKGIFMFLCQECYDSKPRIISTRSRQNHIICSNLEACHNFCANKCLAFVMKTTTVNYRKVRPLSALCYMDLCRQAMRYGCQREDNCHFAHSFIELKTWKVQRDTDISPDDIVKISTRYQEQQEQNSSKHKVNRPFSPAGRGGGKPRGAGGAGGAGAGRSLNMNMKFACAQCWRDGVISEPDKNLKYCAAKARHMWPKEQRILLVKSLVKGKWVHVRPLPHAKNFPVQYEICNHVIEKRKCTYTGNCMFAHSQEEKEMWMYMKNNDLRDMQQIYDMWLSLTHSQQGDGAVLTQLTPEEKYIIMPTDYAEPMSGSYCRLCGRHSNSERQWQQHISSEKHKDQVFKCEGEEEALTWSYRFPGTCFDLCPRLDGECPDGMSCDYAHSPEELQEWMERRGCLRRKLAKAREEMLIMPDEFDFGKYNFLLQD
ncbi:zinc finger CCCH domain-containing protein 7B-like isoform X2 [Genypterus blacodes]|uniref:zinc finger CCCH domain-containing protein 7B-like isoform X2 n=1 Tax=Genypterus blacodes TaxID=154954 RepID=UPI003F776C89